MNIRASRLHHLILLTLLTAGALAVTSGCSNDPNTTGIDDPALQGATVGEVETLVFDNQDGTSERQHFLNLAGGDRLRLVFTGETVPQSLTSGDRIGVWGDRLSDVFQVSHHIVIPPADDTITSALIGANPRPQTAVFVIVDLGGGSNVTNDMANTTVFSPGNNFASVYNKLSFGIMKMTGDVQGPFSYPMTTCDYNGLKTAVKPMITGTYNHYMWYFGSKVSACAWSGIGSEGNNSKPQSDAWFNASTGCTVLVQEVGHNMGWMHSSTLACPGASFVNDPTTCTDSEYGNRMTPMGSGCGMLNAHDLWYGQLLGGCNGVKVTTSGTFNLFPLENACNAIQGIQIPMVTTGRMATPMQGNGNQPLKNYYLEYRTKTGLDANITSAVYVYAGDDIHVPTKTSNWSWLLDMNPATTTFDGLAAGGVFTDPNNDIKITVVSADATKAVVQIDITGGAGGAPTCIDSSTLTAPGPTDCGSGPTTGTGGSTGTGGATGTGGTGGSSGTGRGGTGGSATTGRGGTGGSATTGRGGAGGSAGGSTGTPGAGGSVVMTGRGGSSGSTGATGAAGTTGNAGTFGTSGAAGTTGSGTGAGGVTGTGTGAAGAGVPPAGAGGSSMPSGQAGTGMGPGQVQGGCSCAIDPIGAGGAWGGTGFLLLAGVVVRRRRRPRPAR